MTYYRAEVMIHALSSRDLNRGARFNYFHYVVAGAARFVDAARLDFLSNSHP